MRSPCRVIGCLLAVLVYAAASGIPAIGSGPQLPPEKTPQPLTLENIFRSGRGGARGPALSPDGRTIAFTAQGRSGAGIYRVAVDRPEAGPEFWTAGNNPVWAPDGRSILFTRESRLWRVDIGSDRAPQPLTRPIKGLRAATFSPDGRTIAFYSTESGHQDIWLVSADGGDPRQLTRQSMPADDGRFEPAWSPDARHIAFVSNAADYWSDDVWLVDVESGRSRQLSRGVMAIGPSVYWSPRGDRLAVLGTSKKDFWYLDLADIFLVDAQSGTETKVEMPIHVTAYGNRAVWSNDGRHIYFIYQERGEDHIWSVPASGGVATRLSNIGGVLSGFDASADARAFAFVRSSATEGSDIYYLPAIGGPERRLTWLAPEWEGLQEPVEVSYRSFDGLYIQGYLYLPPGVEKGSRCPALVQVHGGGTNSYTRSQNLVEQYLASKGFVVLAINYRGGSGFGRAFQDLGIGDWTNAQALDAGAAADYLRTLPYVNGKVGIYGGSYGGTMSMAAITRTPDKFDAAVPMRGIYSQAATIDLRDRVGKLFVKTGHGGLPHERPDAYAKSNTFERFAEIRVPVLIMHGELDNRAPFRNFELAVAELTRLNKEFEARSYPGEGHGFRNPDNQIDMYSRLEDFFRRHLGGCAAR